MEWLTGKVSAYIGGGMLVVMLGLAIALTVTRGTLASARTEIAAMKQSNADEIAAHKISNASLAQCQAIVANDNAQSDARAKAMMDSKSADAANATKNNKLEASTAPARAALSAIAKAGGGSGPCKVPEAVAANLRGL